MKTYDKITGEQVDVRYVSQAVIMVPYKEEPRGERIVDDTLFVPSLASDCKKVQKL